ncbi:hypothetical protein GF337_20425 [candidate division KSB1 bacterium]|nr:hypothetical protein [candidate division KSB1 bacterium]
METQSMKKYQIFDKKSDDDENADESKNYGQRDDGVVAKKQLETVVLNGIYFSGDIKGAHDIYLNGEFEGTIELSARLYVGQTGKLQGEVKAENIIIEGEVKGTLEAEEKMEVRDGGICNGDILAPSVMISDKAFFQGKVTMTEEKEEDNEKIKQEAKSPFKKSEDSKSQTVTVVETDEADTESKKNNSKVDSKKDKVKDESKEE